MHCLEIVKEANERGEYNYTPQKLDVPETKKHSVSRTTRLLEFLGLKKVPRSRDPRFSFVKRKYLQD